MVHWDHILVEGTSNLGTLFYCTFQINISLKIQKKIVKTTIITRQIKAKDQNNVGQCYLLLIKIFKSHIQICHSINYLFSLLITFSYGLLGASGCGKTTLLVKLHFHTF